MLNSKPLSKSKIAGPSMQVSRVTRDVKLRTEEDN